jgi:hygromycin-B 7''-O-kinase
VLDDPMPRQPAWASNRWNRESAAARGILPGVATRFPRAVTAQELGALPRDDPRLAAAAGALCRALGLGDAKLFAAGSLPVFAAGDAHVVKLYPPFLAHECERERSVLSKLNGALPVATPQVAASGEVDGWRYLVMERIPGEPLDGLWPSLTPSERVRLAGELGRFLRALHAVETRDLADARVDWPRFVREQKERCVEAQRRKSLAPRWLEQIPAFLASTELAPVGPPVLLHTEIMRAHVFAVRQGTGWSLSGVVDFEPAMVGAAEYEFASGGVFLTRGSGPALRALLLAYGYGERDLGPLLQRRLLAYTLLHRYSNLRWYLELLPTGDAISTLDALAARWWALGDEPEIAEPCRKNLP